MLIAQVTDCHIKPPGRIAYGRVDTAAFLDQLIDHLTNFSPQIDAVIATGDLTDAGTPEEYAELRARLGRLHCPVFVIPGNHDDAKTMLSAFADHSYLSGGSNSFCYAVPFGLIRLVGLDTTIEGAPEGRLGDERLSWLDRTLAEDATSTLIFLHHPPFETGIDHMDVQNLQDADEFLSIVRHHRHVAHIACGHVHRAVCTTINGVAMSIAPNAAHSVTLDLNHKAPSTFTMEPPAVRIFRIDERGIVTAHLSYLGAFSGPYPFHDASGAYLP